MPLINGANLPHFHTVKLDSFAKFYLWPVQSQTGIERLMDLPAFLSKYHVKSLDLEMGLFLEAEINATKCF